MREIKPFEPRRLGKPLSILLAAIAVVGILHFTGGDRVIAGIVRSSVAEIQEAN
jgi:uncharacterized membrane protein